MPTFCDNSKSYPLVDLEYLISDWMCVVLECFNHWVYSICKEGGLTRVHLKFVDKYSANMCIYIRVSNIVSSI